MFYGISSCASVCVCVHFCSAPKHQHRDMMVWHPVNGPKRVTLCHRIDWMPSPSSATEHQPNSLQILCVAWHFARFRPRHVSSDTLAAQPSQIRTFLARARATKSAPSNASHWKLSNAIAPNLQTWCAHARRQKTLFFVPKMNVQQHPKKA